MIAAPFQQGQWYTIGKLRTVAAGILRARQPAGLLNRSYRRTEYKLSELPRLAQTVHRGQGYIRDGGVTPITDKCERGWNVRLMQHDHFVIAPFHEMWYNFNN
jgi:hypothetical protein